MVGLTEDIFTSPVQVAVAELVCPTNYNFSYIIVNMFMTHPNELKIHPNELSKQMLLLIFSVVSIAIAIFILLKIFIV